MRGVFLSLSQSFVFLAHFLFPSCKVAWVSGRHQKFKPLVLSIVRYYIGYHAVFVYRGKRAEFFMFVGSHKEATMKVLVVYYSMYGHVYQLAKSIAAGAASIEGANVEIRRVPETLPREVLEKMGALKTLEAQKDVPVCTVSELESADAIIFGTPTRFGNMCGQMRQFLDATGGLWARGALVGKIGSVFTSSGTQHGGQESTILSFHLTLLHQGMVVAGLPYAFQGQTRIDEVTGGSPYGASTIAGPDGSRNPTENELAGARFQGEYIAKLAKKLAG